MKILQPALNSSRLKQILKEIGIPAIRMARDMGWSHTKLYWFIAGYYRPSANDRQQILDYLHNNDTSNLFIEPANGGDDANFK